MSLVYSTHKWDKAPQDLKDWIVAEHGAGPWAILSVVPDGYKAPRLNIPSAEPDAAVSRPIPGGVVLAYPPRTTPIVEPPKPHPVKPPEPPATPEEKKHPFLRKFHKAERDMKARKGNAAKEKAAKDKKNG